MAQLQNAAGYSLQGGGTQSLQASPITLQSGPTAPTIQPAYGGDLNNVTLGGVTQGASTTAPQAPVDPWAGTPWGSQANYNKALSDFNSAKDNTYGSITDLTNDTASKYNSGILDFLDQLKTGQRNIDRSATQNELSRNEGRMGVLDMVGTGLRSGGVVLNNAGAANSSAGEALGHAYSELGRKELSKVGNQYALGQDNIANQQQDLNTGTETFRRHTDESKVSSVNAIVQTASAQLAQLNTAAQSASLPDRIAIEQEKVRIRNEATAKLAAFDAVLNNGVAGVAPRSAEANRVEAQRLLTAGTAPENSFDFTSSIPAQFQNTGPFTSSLPIFTGKRRDLVGA